MITDKTKRDKLIKFLRAQIDGIVSSYEEAPEALFISSCEVEFMVMLADWENLAKVEREACRWAFTRLSESLELCGLYWTSRFTQQAAEQLLGEVA
jgi:hypothetical protein